MSEMSAASMLKGWNGRGSRRERSRGRRRPGGHALGAPEINVKGGTTVRNPQSLFGFWRFLLTVFKVNNN